MSHSHNNQLNMVSLFDEEQPQPSRKRSHVDYAFLNDLHQRGDYNAMHRPAPAVAPVKVEEGATPVSYTPTYDSDYAESDHDDWRPSKIPKINKDGVPRKPRQPRPKLLKWSDNDWKNVVLGIVWACGETGVQIPFDQAAQVVGDSCTAGALQQAILKLRGKQIDEGYKIPSLRMAWTRKNKRASSSSSSTNAGPQQATGQDRMAQSRPSLVVKLKATVSNSVLAKNGLAAATQINGGPIGPQGGGFGVTFPMTDIHTTGIQGLTVVSGLPSVPSSFGGNYRDIVKQAVPTQYNRGIGSTFDFEEHMRNMEAQNFQQDIKDHEEYDIVCNDSQEDLLASSETDNGPSRGFLPEMSSSLGHTYESPYSFFQAESSSRLHSLDAPSSSHQERQDPDGLPHHLDAGHFPDLFAHDVFSNSGFEYDFNAGH